MACENESTTFWNTESETCIRLSISGSQDAPTVETEVVERHTNCCKDGTDNSDDDLRQACGAY